MELGSFIRVSPYFFIMWGLLSGCDSAPGDDGTETDESLRIRHVMPWPAGSASDIAMRGFLFYVEQYLGARIYTENIAGGMSARGMLRTRLSPADGRTIGTMTYDILTVEFFDLVPITWGDFEILATITEHPSALIGRSDRWPSLSEFRSEALGGPSRLKVGNVGNGGVFHQHAVAMEEALGVDFVHVPYPSTSGQLSALLGREIDAVVASLPVVLPYVQEGSLRVLGVMAAERQPVLPEAPTFVEAGFDVVFGSFRMLVAPQGLDDDVRASLRRGIHRAWQDSSFQAWAARSGIGATWKGPEESVAFLEDLSPRVRALIETIR